SVTNTGFLGTNPTARESAADRDSSVAILPAAEAFFKFPAVKPMGLVLTRVEHCLPVERSMESEVQSKAKIMGQKAQHPKTLTEEVTLDPRGARASLPSSFGTGIHDTTANRDVVIGYGTKQFKTNFSKQLRVKATYNRFIISDIHACGTRFRTRGIVTREAQFRRSSIERVHTRSKLVIVEDVLFLLVVQEACSSSESESDHNEIDCLVSKTKKKSLNLAHALEVDRKTEVLVRSIIPQDPKRLVDESLFVLADEVTDIKVEKLLSFIHANDVFSKDMFKGGKTKFDVEKMPVEVMFKAFKAESFLPLPPNAQSAAQAQHSTPPRGNGGKAGISGHADRGGAENEQNDPKKDLLKVADDWDDVGIILISELQETSETIGSSPSTTTFDPLHAAQGSVDLTLNQPSCSTVHRSCLTNANLSFRPNCTRSKTPLSQNRKRRRKPPRSVLDDITNISHSLSNGNEETTTNIHRDINQEDDELLDDDFVGGISHYEGELDFDFSSQESTDSELEADNVEVHATPANDQICQVHATPATYPYRPPPFCMKSILERCQNRERRSTKVLTKRKEEGYFMSIFTTFLVF
ncbi:unnamed protein product, partial [Brassica rapa]